MRVKAKFKVDSVTKHQWGGETAKLFPVYEGATANTEEDKHFSDATPSGSIELTITNKDVHGHFVPGESHYVTFEKA
jgi:hypothetical protein